MNKDDDKIQQYASFIRKICDEDKLRHFDKTGIAAVVEYGVRITGRQKKLSTRFHLIADLLREANYWAEKDGSDVVTEKHVDKAIEKRVYRVNLIEEKIQEMIDDGTILIDSDGMVVGQVNGLSVYNLGRLYVRQTLPDHRQDFLGKGRHYQYRKRSGDERPHP